MSKKGPYRNFSQVDGQHDFREAVADGYVDYKARKRRGGSVFFFNFPLAKEMGLIKKSHPHRLNAKLSKRILDTFSIEIINEYDLMHKRSFPKRDIKKHPYMATCYLQGQHPDKRGRTSGDGRSIWNGVYRGKGRLWDITSCGTGATRLSPATAIEKKFFKTGNKIASYGCGRADLSDGVCEAILSEIFHRNHIRTTRLLAIIAFKDGSSINVRTYPNLLRPAHFFHHVKQGNYHGLKGSVDYYIARQVKNGEISNIRNRNKRYKNFLKQIAYQFAEIAAVFEMEYIFCWLDWDGDNILVDGGIIDYGSIRQFGLFHHEYRYDDVERMSTNIKEQKYKAKHIVQTFAQMTNFLINGKKRELSKFSKHKSLKYFEKVFETKKYEVLLFKFGFKPEQIVTLMADQKLRTDLKKFRKIYELFERVKSKKGLYKVSDGVTQDAVFCIRDIMRELPHLMTRGEQKFDTETFMSILKSEYASKKDAVLTPNRKKQINQFQKLYRRIILRASAVLCMEKKRLIHAMCKRSALINRYERVTGDAILHIAKQFILGQKKMSSKSFHALIEKFINDQITNPEGLTIKRKAEFDREKQNIEKLFNSMMRLVRAQRESL